jgi:hypothetical protein
MPAPPLDGARHQGDITLTSDHRPRLNKIVDVSHALWEIVACAFTAPVGLF